MIKLDQVMPLWLTSVCITLSQVTLHFCHSTLIQQSFVLQQVPLGTTSLHVMSPQSYISTTEVLCHIKYQSTPYHAMLCHISHHKHNWNSVLQWEEKSNPYSKAPSGLPLVQHSLNVMLDYYHRGMITLEHIIQKMCHDPARCFRLLERGYLDEGTYADVVIFDANHEWTVNREGLFYKCGWSPLEGKAFKGKVMKTFINGNLIYNEGSITEAGKGMRVLFNPER